MSGALHATREGRFPEYRVTEAPLARPQRRANTKQTSDPPSARTRPSWQVRMDKGIARQAPHALRKSSCRSQPPDQEVSLTSCLLVDRICGHLASSAKPAIQAKIDISASARPPSILRTRHRRPTRSACWRRWRRDSPRDRGLEAYREDRLMRSLRITPPAIHLKIRRRAKRAL